MVYAITIGGFDRFEALTFRLLGNANALCRIWLRLSGVLIDFSVMFRTCRGASVQEFRKAKKRYSHFRDLRHSRGDF
jgi:hypothetical protein